MKNKKSEKVAIYPVVLPEGNLGDILIHKALIHSIKDRTEIAITDKYIGDDTFSRLGLIEKDKAINKGYKRGVFVKEGSYKLPSYVMMGPGHFFTTGPKLISKQWKKRLFWIIGQTKTLIYLSMLKILGVKVCRFGVSIGPLAGIDNWFERRFASCMHFYSVRDSNSIKFVKSIGINKVQEFPDCAFLFPLQIQNHQKSEKYIVLSFRSEIHTNHPDKEYANKILDAIEKIAADYNSDEYTIYITSQVDVDLKFGKVIYDRLAPNYKVKQIDKLLSEDDLPKIYGNAEMVFSNRLHVLLFAMRSLTLPIGLTYKHQHSKLTGIFRDMGIEDLILDAEEVISIEKLNEILLKKKGFLNKIEEEWNKRHELGHRQLSSVFS